SLYPPNGHSRAEEKTSMQVREGRQVALDSLGQDTDDDLDIKLATINTQDGARIEGLLWFQAGTKPKTAIITMHPANNLWQNYLPRPAARAGLAAFKVSTRYAGDDGPLIFENILLDIAAAINWLKGEGFEHVVLEGNSGGGPMMALYQSQAE